jgi:hypothetical protein
MTSSKDVERTILRNKLLGRWAAGKLGFTAQQAETYSDALARDALDPERGDVFGRIRRDFEAAGVNQSDEEIRRVMTELTVRAGSLTPTKQGNSADAAAVALARNLISR